MEETKDELKPLRPIELLKAFSRNRGNRIRRKAKGQGIRAIKSRKDGMWYFADDRNNLISPDNGMTADEALSWINQEAGIEE